MRWLHLALAHPLHQHLVAQAGAKPRVLDALGAQAFAQLVAPSSGSARPRLHRAVELRLVDLGTPLSRA